MELVTNKNCYSWNNFTKEQDNFNENEEDTGNVGLTTLMPNPNDSIYN